MKKLLKIITGVTLSLAMAIGVGVGVANNNKKAEPVYATTLNGTASTSITSGNSYLVTAVYNNTRYYLTPGESALGTGSVIATSIADVGTATSSMCWTFSGSGTSWSISANGFYLANTDSNNGVKTQNNSQTWTSSFSGNNLTLTGASSRKLALYQGSNWRCYTTSSGVQSLQIYEFSAGGGDPTPTITLSKDSISGEVNDEFSFTWTEQDLESPITWSPASASTDIIDYEVNTETKTVTGTLKKAGEVTLTATSGDASDSIDFVVSEHQTHRKYTVISKTAVSQSGDTMTGATPTYSQTYGTAKQATKGNSMTLSITGLTRKVSISKLILSMHSNQSEGAGSVSITIDGKPASFIAGTSSSVGAGFNTFGDNSEYSNSYKNVTWAGLNYTAKSSIVINIYCIGTNSLYCESFDIFFTEEDNNDVVTALSVSPNTWTGFDSQTLNVASFTVSVTTNGEPGISVDYSYLGIGYMNGDTFVARSANFASGHPTTDDTRLCWKANYPTTVGGSTYLYAYVTLNVSHDGISTIAISGNMSKTSYFTTDSWDASGLVVKAIYAGGSEETVTGSASFKFYRESTLENEVATPNALGVGNNQTIYVKATYSDISNVIGYSQTVTVTIEHGSIESDPLTAAEAIGLVSSQNNNYETTKQYYIHGVISQIDLNELSEANNWATFWLEEDNATFGFEAYKIKPDAGCTNYGDLRVGAEVLIKCKIKKYSGSIIENGSVSSLLSITYSAPELAGITLNKNSLLLGVGEEFDLTASPNPLGAELGAVTWNSSNNDVATVVDGTVTAVAPGSAIITVEAGGFSTTCNVDVSLKSTLKYTLNSSTYANTYTNSELTEVLNLDSNLFNVTYDKNGASNEMYLINNTTESVRMYATKQTTKGNKFTVAISNEYTIDKISIAFYNNASETAQVLCGSNVIEESSGYYLIGGTEFTVFNNNSSVATNTQVKISKIDIFYRNATAVEKVSRLNTQSSLAYSGYTNNGDETFTYDNLGIRFGGTISSALWSELSSEVGGITGYGVLLTDDSIGSDTIEDYYNVFKTNENTVDEALAEMCSGGVTNYSSSNTRHETPAKAAPSVVNGNYTWRLYYRIAEANRTDTLVAVAYIRTSTGIIFLQEERTSVKELATDLIANETYGANPFGGSLSYLARP